MRGPGAGLPAGDVTFRDGAVELGIATLDASGVARLTVATLGTGGHSLTASFPGSAALGGSTSPRSRRW